LNIAKISHVSIWNWIQKHKPWKHLRKRKIRVCHDETAIKVDSSELIWFWVIIEPKHREILAAEIFKEQNMFITERGCPR